MTSRRHIINLFRLPFYVLLVGTVLVRCRQEALANGANASYLRMMQYMSLQQGCGKCVFNPCDAASAKVVQVILG